MLAPMITPIAPRRDSTLALTSPTVITVIAVEDWMTPVMMVPANTPLSGVPAILASSSRIRLADSAWMPRSMNSSPSRKMPNPPMTGARISLKMSTSMRCPQLFPLVGGGVDQMREVQGERANALDQ